MPFLIALGVCIRCRMPFAFNPEYVPAVRVNGEKEPLCRPCVDALNRKRAELGLAPHDVHPDAYDELEVD